MAEQAHAQALAKFETKGGPDGTTPQKHLAWLEGVPPKLVKQYLNRVYSSPVEVMEEIRARYGTTSSGSAAGQTGKA